MYTVLGLNLLKLLEDSLKLVLIRIILVDAVRDSLVLVLDFLDLLVLLVLLHIIPLISSGRDILALDISGIEHWFQQAATRFLVCGFHVWVRGDVGRTAYYHEVRLRTRRWLLLRYQRLLLLAFEFWVDR